MQKTILILMVALGGLFTEAALGEAQDREPASAEAPDTSLAEVVVTAQKRAENIQKVPISIVSVNATTLENAGVRSAMDLPLLVPNLTANRGPQTASARLSIRGLGAPGNSAVEPSAGVFVDGIYIPHPGSMFGPFLDIANVEVLRGPQGTLFGRNTSVGAISLHSAMPTEEFSGEVNVEGGTGQRYRASGDVNIPLSNDISTRTAAIGERFGGYYHNELDGTRVGSTNTLAFRETVKAQLGPNLTWVLRGDYGKLTGDGLVLYELLPNTLTAAGKARLDALVGAQNLDLKPLDFKGIERLHGGLFDRNAGASSDLSLSFGEGFTARLLDAYRDWHNEQSDGDLSMYTLSMLTRDAAYDSQSQSHELQLISPKNQLLGGRLDFVAGLYFFQENYSLDFVENIGPDYCAIAVAAANRGRCLAGVFSDAGEYTLHQHSRSLAEYGQATLNVLPKLDLTLGARYTDDHKSGRFVQVVNNPAFSIRAPENTPLRFSDGRLTYRANLDYNLSADAMLFLSYSTGYKSGGFNSGAGSIALTSAQRTFAPETVKDYEGGFKTQFFDRQVTFNTTFYRMDVSGYQDRQIDSNAAVVVRNVGKLRQQGVELDGSARANRHLNLNVAVAYLDSRFLDYRGAPGLPGFGGVQDLTGKPANTSPRWSGATGLEWHDRLGSRGWTWSLRSDVSFTSAANLGQVTDGNPDTVQKGYALLGARLNIMAPDDQFSFAVFGQNLADKGYCALTVYQIFDGPLGLRNSSNGSTLTRCIAGAPRTIGGFAAYRF